MNEKIVSNYLGDPNVKQAAAPKPQVQAEFFNKLKQVEKLYKSNNDFIKAYNDVIDCNIYEHSTQQAQMFINLAEQFAKEGIVHGLYAFKDTIFQCTIEHNMFNPIVFDINNVTNGVDGDNNKKALNKLYKSFYNELEKIGKEDIYTICLKYYLFFSNNAFKYPVLNKLLWRFPNVEYFANNLINNYIPSYNKHICYFSSKNTSYVSVYGDILKLDIDFYCKFLGINIPEKYISDLKKMINVMTKVIQNHCCEPPQPDTTFYYCVYTDYLNENLSHEMRHMHKLEFSNKSVRLTDCENLQQSGKIQMFNSIDMIENGCLHDVVNNYNPQLLYSVLISIVRYTSDFGQVDNISKALAMTFVAKISKRPIVVVSCSDTNIVQAKELFKQIICSGENNYLFVVDMGYTLKNMTHKKFEQNIFKMDDTKIKAFFIDNFEDKVPANIKEKIIDILKDAGNIQFFIFQTSKNVDYIPTDNLIHINLSDWNCLDNSFLLDTSNALWGRLYLPIYGLHLIFKERNSKRQFLLAESPIEDIKEDIEEDIFDGMDKDKIIKKMSEDFISRCFVSREEAIERKRKRKKDIATIKTENPAFTDEYIKKRLGDQPLFSTPKDKFLEYANVYLNTQYPQNILKKYDIKNETIFEYIKSTYEDIFSYEPLNLRYTGWNQDRPMGFQLLGIKSPWKEIEKELQESNVNKIIGDDEKIEKQLHNLIEILPKTIDLKPLSRFADTNIHCHIETY